jgi:hypothetical protein
MLPREEINMNIPIYRAKRLDNGEYVKGQHISYGFQDFISVGVYDKQESIGATHEALYVLELVPIDQSTLAIHFHGKWFSIQRINEIMKDQVSCRVCKDTGVNHRVQKRPNKWSSEPCEFCKATCIYEEDKKMFEFPNKSIRVMLHALGIADVKNGDYLQPNKRCSPYPTSHRNYYQTEQCDIWDELVKNGFAEYRKSKEIWQCFYFVTKEGKEHLKSLGYKWHERKSK